jgi:hypothetical protein
MQHFTLFKRRNSQKPPKSASVCADRLDVN